MVNGIKKIGWFKNSKFLFLDSYLSLYHILQLWCIYDIIIGKWE